MALEENQKADEETLMQEAVQEQDTAQAQDASKEETAAQAESSEDAEGVSETEGKEKKKLFGKKDKKDKKDKQIEELTAQAAELTDRLKRTMAEFDNYRKRTDKEKSAMFDMGAKSIIEKILPVIDNFERGLAGVPEEAKSDAFVDGMDKVYKQMLKNLTEAGLEPIEAVGKQFDPNIHNAVMHTEDENLGENTVANEFQKGYMYKGSVVRHSMVQVAN